MRSGVIVIGLFYLVLAYAGIAEISDETTNIGGGLYGGNSPDIVWGVFGVNTAMNFIHILLGAFAIIGGIILSKSAMITWCVAGAFAVLFGYGVIAIATNTGTTALAITWGDNILHIVTAAVIGVIAVLARAPHTHDRRAHRAPARFRPGHPSTS